MLCDANIFLNLMKHLGQKCEPPQDSILKPMLQTYVDRVIIIIIKIILLLLILNI